MKAEVVLWAGPGVPCLEEDGRALGFVQREEFEIADERLKELTFALFEKGWNVMLHRPNRDNSKVVVYVDTQRFSQR